jgi:tetratricopeptide (TPR) repeat protein
MPKFDVSQDSLQPEPAARIFIGRERQVADFRASVSYLLKKAHKPTGDFYPHLFIAHGEGGMGKTTLLNRWLEVAREEGMSPERIITIDLDYKSYPSPHDLAHEIIVGLCQAFPGFERGYREVQAHRQIFKGRYDDLRNQWELWEAHVENGTTAELMRTWSKNLARIDLKKAKFGNLHAPVMLDNEADDTRRELRALRGFLDANGRGPQTFAELLEQELGENAALFDSSTSAHALGNDIYELAEQSPLVLALDTYELADRHHDWLVELYFEVGDQVLLLLAGRNAVHKGDHHERRFSKEYRPLVQSYDLGHASFSDEEVRQFVEQTLGRAPDDENVERIQQISRGVPLAVEALAGALKDNGDLRMFVELDTRSAERNEIIRRITNRFMRYAVEDSKRDSADDKTRKQADRTAIRGLALLQRPDPELICALWACDDQTVESRISTLGSRHSFVFARAGSFELHDLVRQFIREDLWHTKSKQFEWPRLRDGLRRVLALVEARLAPYLTTPREESYDTAEFREAVLDRLNLLLWLDELDEAKRWLLNRWLEARHYHRKLANDLGELLNELTPSQTIWRKIQQALDPEDDWQPRFAALEPFINLLEPHPHMLHYYLWADQNEVFWVSDEDDLQQINQKIALLERARCLDPEFTLSIERLAEALSRRARYYAWEGKEYNKAITDLDYILQLNPNNKAIFFDRGAAKYELNDYKGSIEDYNRVIEFDPDNAAAFNNRGGAKDDIGDYTGAISDYDRAIDIKPDYTAALNNRGISKYNLGEYADAIVDFNSIIDIDSEKFNTFMNRGVCRRYMGDFIGALADFEQALLIHPEDSDSMYNLACYFSAIQKDVDSSVVWLQRAIDGDDQNRKSAIADPDFDPIRDDPRFRALVGE